jgi:hypothetical protein
MKDFDSSRLLGLGPEDFYLAYRGEEIVGCVATWNQSLFRQTHIENYSGALRMLRPFYNVAAQFSPLHKLPATGQKIPYLYLSHVGVKDNATDIFAVLLRNAYRDRCKSKYQFLIAGLHERDPLLAVLDDYRSIAAGGRLFAIYYPDDAEFAARIDNRIPYIDMATV